LALFLVEGDASAFGIEAGAWHVVLTREQSLSVVGNPPVVNSLRPNHLGTATNKLIGVLGMHNTTQIFLVYKLNLMQNLAVKFVDSQSKRH
jgi:hypothetical protein